MSSPQQMHAQRRSNMTTKETHDSSVAMSSEWYWHPKLPISVSGVFAWPPNPAKIIAWLAKSWLTLSPTTLWVVLACVVWIWASPSTDTMKTLSWDWVGFVYIRNLVIMTAVAGGLHVYFYILRPQQDRRRFDGRPFKTSEKKFLFSNQVRDNMFWTLVSGVTIWTIYEVAYFWLYANGYLPRLTWSENPVWFVALFLIIPIWSSMHFYWIHRALHWQPIYKAAHALHHKNITIGPWTGISMHPLEHIPYFSSVLLNFICAAHPIHMLFHLYLQALNPACSHCGYDGIVVKGETRLSLGDFFHQLHHRYFACNYGTSEMPWDVWFGSFHDGTPEATQHMRDRQRLARKSAAQPKARNT